MCNGRILIVGCEDKFIDCLRTKMNDDGFTLLVSSCKEAYDTARTVKPELIVIDIDNSQNTEELIRSLKCDVDTKECSIVLCSNDSNNKKSMNGYLDFIPKSLNKCNVIKLKSYARLSKIRGLTNEIYGKTGDVQCYVKNLSTRH